MSVKKSMRLLERETNQAECLIISTDYLCGCTALPEIEKKMLSLGQKSRA